MAKMFAIEGVKGDFRFFKKKKEDTISDFLKDKPFGETWESYRARGYKLVQVDLKVVAVIDPAPKKESDPESPFF